MLVLLLALCMAAPVAADSSATYVEVDSWNELELAVSEWKDKDTMRNVVVTQDVAKMDGGSNYVGIPVTGKVTIMPGADAGEVTIDAKQTGRIFKVDGRDLTLVGNGVATLTLTNGSAQNGALSPYSMVVISLSH